MFTNVKKQTTLFVFSLLAVFLLVPGLMMAQTGKIVGTVTDAEDGKPLPGTNIVVQGTELGAAADEDGNYLILNVPPGTFTVAASIIGYAQLNKEEVQVRVSQTTKVDFAMQQSAIVGQEVTVVAERPVVERDLTASKETISAESFENTWVSSVQEAVRTQSGVNIHGGVRGSFQLGLKYRVDGQSISDAGTGMSYVPVNTTSVQEMEVLTGGFNAEYGQASSGVVDVVTKMSRDRIHGSFKGRARPPGVYHWGGNLYSEDRWEWRKTDWNGNPAPGGIEWWQNETGGASYYENMTPAERLAAWKQLLQANPTLYDYANRWDLEGEGTLTGPITDNLSFMASGRYQNGVLVFPNAHSYNPEWSGQLRLSYDITGDTRLTAGGLAYGTKNSGNYKIPYLSSETVGNNGNPGAYFTSAYDQGKYWPFGSYGYGGGTDLGRVRPPEYFDTFNGSLKLTHVFSPKTLLEVNFKHLQTNHEATFKHVQKKVQDQIDFAQANNLPLQMMNNPVFGQLYRIGMFGTKAANWENALSFDFTSQVHPAHQLKAGLEFSTQYWMFNFWALGTSSYTDLDMDLSYPGIDYGPNNYAYPWEASAYLQDKIELQGMVVNAGLRLDMFNGNKMVGSNMFDPLQLSPYTRGNRGDYNLISFDPGSRYAEHTPTQIVLSPRIGISHPITETTILHFMYGHFNQRPGWNKILMPQWISGSGESLDGSAWYATSGPRNGNPWLGYERVIQYEVGFDQSIADLLRLDATLYYKDGKGLTSMGITSGGRNDQGYGTSGAVVLGLNPDPDGGGEGPGNTGTVYTYLNGGSLESRGLEVSVETAFMRNISIRGIYNASFSTTQDYGPSYLYYEFGDPAIPKAGVDQFSGGSNGDRGTSGNQNERWNPNHQLKLNAVFSSPTDFGPGFGKIHPLGNWTLNWYTVWNSGQLYTYYPPGYSGPQEPDNRRWFPKTYSNAKLTRYIDIGQNIRFRAFLDVNNVFNQSAYRLFGGGDMTNYQENGDLPVHSLTGEELAWDYYDLDLLPREIYFGIGLDF